MEEDPPEEAVIRGRGGRPSGRRLKRMRLQPLYSGPVARVEPANKVGMYLPDIAQITVTQGNQIYSTILHADVLEEMRAVHIATGGSSTIKRIINVPMQNQDTQQIIQKDFALKCTNASSFHQRAMERELEVLSELTDSEYIRKFYALVKNPKSELAIMVLEWMDASLDTVYKTAHRTQIAMSDRFVKQLVLSIVEALKMLRAQLNSIHRDIKPSNILVHRVTRSIKLADFGICSTLRNSIVVTHNNRGTQSFFSPEHIAKGQTIELRVQADVWALGITLICVVSGNYPYPPNAFDQQAMIVAGDSPRLSEDEVPGDPSLPSFIAACLEKDIDLRAKYDDLVTHDYYPSTPVVPDNEFFDRVFATIQARK